MVPPLLNRLMGHTYYDAMMDSAGKPHHFGHLPGYTGYCPGRRYTEGLTFGAVTQQINKKVLDGIQKKLPKPRGPKCTAVPQFSSCHSLPMSVYTQRPQSASVFTDQAEVDKLMKTLTWYNRRATSSSEGNSVGSFERRISINRMTTSKNIAERKRIMSEGSVSTEIIELPSNATKKVRRRTTSTQSQCSRGSRVSKY